MSAAAQQRDLQSKSQRELQSESQSAAALDRAARASTVAFVVDSFRTVWTAQPDAGPCIAAAAFDSVYFQANREFAEAVADRWYIVSAKFGILDPQRVLEGPYEETFQRARVG